MSDHGNDAVQHAGATTKTFLWVWIILIAITGIEVFLGYKELEPKLMLTLLMGLSLVKAGLIMGYFMHLKYERKSLSWMLVPAMVFCIGMMLVYILWDAVRLSQMRPT